MKTPNFDLTDEECEQVGEKITDAAWKAASKWMSALQKEVKKLGVDARNLTFFTALAGIKQAFFLIEANRLSDAQVKELRAKRFESIEGRLEQLEELASRIESKGIEYRGTWDEHEQYERGDVVTWDGHCWHANCLTRSRPFEGDSPTPDWSLMVRRGRKGKDAR
jgi:hypothetical protein